MGNPKDCYGTGLTGKKGTPEIDVTKDVSIYVDEYSVNGKSVREGHTKIAHQTNNDLKKIAPNLKTSRSALIRMILDSFVKFYNESKALGADNFFEAEKTIDAWLQERSDMKILLNSVLNGNKKMIANSKSPEVILISELITTLAKMVNLNHKKQI